MIVCNKNFIILNSFVYYYFNLFNYFNFIFFKNKIFFFNFKVLINKINYLKKNQNSIFFKFNNFKKINKYLNININYKLISPKIFQSFNYTNKSLVNNFFFYKKNSTLNFNFFNLFFLFNYSMYNSSFVFNANFNLFYLYNSSKKLIIINSTKFLNRWKDSYDLIFNIFFYNFNPLIFGTNLFKKQILALNWNYNYFDINLWRYYFPFFTFKLNNYNKKTSFFLDKLNSLNVNFFIVSDCSYHFKNLYYFNKKNLYTIGLVNVNLNPWIVSYPIISFFESYIIQLFFFKFLIFIEKKVLFTKYLMYRNSWFDFLINKKIY